MTQQPPGAPPEAPSAPDAPGRDSDQPGSSGPRDGRPDMRDLSRLRRTTGSHKLVAGVAGGLARHFDIDPLVVRVALVVLVFFGGAGLIVYGACWLLVPEDGEPTATLNFDERTRSVALVIAGVIAGLALLGDTMGGFGFPWPLAIVALVVLAVATFGDRDKPKPTAPPVPHIAVPTTDSTGWSMPTEQRGWAGATDTTIWQPARQDWKPRKRGPRLFWFTLALSALAVGLLGIADLAGASVADSAYPALVLGICGAMLLVGAFYGRAGGIIFLGLMAALATAGATGAQRWDGDQLVRTPMTAASVQDRYEVGAGDLVLDLTGVSDLDNLDGRTIQVRGGAASLEVRVPPGLDVDVTASAGLGEIQVFGDAQDGAGIDLSGSHDGGLGVPRITLDLEVGLGEIDVSVDDETTLDQDGALR